MKKLAIIILLTSCIQLKAQTTKDIETDRPDQTETPFSVGTKMFQAENGYSVWKDKGGVFYSNVVSLLRYGITEKFELRAEIAKDRYNKESINYNVQGITPVKVGFKANIFEEKGWLPKTSIIAHVALPKVASKAFKAQYAAPSFRFTSQHTVSKKQSLSYNIGGEWSGDYKSFTPLYTLASGYDFSDFWYGYVELFGFFPKDVVAEHTLAGGFAFLVKPNVQFDISGGYGLTKTATKYYWALGLSFRLPK